MGLNLEALAKALRISVEFTDEDRNRVKEMREEGIGLSSVREEIIAGKILRRIKELVEKVDVLK